MPRAQQRIAQVVGSSVWMVNLDQVARFHRCKPVFCDRLLNQLLHVLSDSAVHADKRIVFFGYLLGAL